MLSVSMYNQQSFSVLLPDGNNYQSNIVSNDTSTNNYTLEAVIDINEILRDLVYTRNLLTRKHAIVGANAAWSRLHTILHNGEDEQIRLHKLFIHNFSATFNNNKTKEGNWVMFWGRVLSKIINSEDNLGMTVTHEYLANDLGDIDNGNILNSFNNVMRNSLDEIDLQTAPGNTRFLASILFAVYNQLFNEGLTADPNEKGASVRLPNDSVIGMRFEHDSINFVIKLKHVTQYIPPVQTYLHYSIDGISEINESEGTCEITGNDLIINLPIAYTGVNTDVEEDWTVLLSHTVAGTATYDVHFFTVEKQTGSAEFESGVSVFILPNAITYNNSTTNFTNGELTHPLVFKISKTSLSIYNSAGVEFFHIENMLDGAPEATNLMSVHVTTGIDTSPNVTYTFKGAYVSKGYNIPVEDAKNILLGLTS